MKPFSIAALQLDLNYSENYDLVAEKTYETCKRYPWVQMIVLSELAVGGSSMSLEFSLEKQLPKFQKIAQELNIWYIPGSFYDHVNDEVKNVAPVISPEGNLATTCAKTYPFLPYEKGIMPGLEPCIFEITSLMPAASITALTPPPAIIPVPWEAGLIITFDAPNFAITS